MADKSISKAGKAHKEIERRFVVSALPGNLSDYPFSQIEQVYVKPGDEHTIRIRREDNRYFRNVKHGSGLVRTETEWELHPIRKLRYRIPSKHHTIELDLYLGQYYPYVVAEVEFSSKAEATAFRPPSWFAYEVTGNPEYSNKRLAKRVAPKDPRLPSVFRQKDGSLPRIFDLNEGLAETIALVDNAPAQRKGPVFVGVAGGSSSGKSSVVAAALEEHYRGRVTVLSMDDYLIPVENLSSLLRYHRNFNLDTPERVEFPLLVKHLHMLKEGRRIEKPIFDFEIGKRDGQETVAPKSIVIVEGLFALNEKLADVFDVKVFVESSMYGQALRRIMRRREKLFTMAQILDYFSAVVMPMQQLHIDTTRSNANVIIRNSYDPTKESSRAGAFDIQLKFRTRLPPDALQKAGAILVGADRQIDKYFNPDNLDAGDSGEQVRIRRHTTGTILTYKGPSEFDGGRKQYRVEVPHHDPGQEVIRAMARIFGKPTVTIKKDRETYSLNGVLIHVDKEVSASEEGKAVALGGFVEIRFTHRTRREARKIIRKLELASPITDTYLQMSQKLLSV